MSKVFFLINSLASGGAEKVMSVLLTELVKQGYTLELICLEKNNFYTIPKEVKVTYLSGFTGKESGFVKFLYLPVLSWRLKKYIQHKRIALVQSHIYRANYINILAKLLGASHCAQIVNAGRVSRYLDQGFLGKINLFLIENLYAKADLLISKADGMQLDMQTLFSFKNKQIVINNPYDIVNIKELSQHIVEDFIFDDNKKYIISIGRLIKLKRNADVLGAIKNLPDNIELLLLGQGNEKTSLQELAKMFNIEKRVHFLGQVSNPYKYLYHSDIFISASESEGFPNVIIESMICGTPVISTDCVSGPREILAPDTKITFQLKDNIELAEYGILYPIGEIHCLTKAIKTMLDNKNLRKEYITKAKRRSNTFSISRIISQYINILG